MLVCWQTRQAGPMRTRSARARMSNYVHIVGRKNHGKTTRVADLVAEFCRRDVRVGTIKHSCHQHDLDTPGKDSYLHRHAGANPAAIVTADAFGVFLRREPDTDFYARLAPWFTDCDLVLIEGGIEASGLKIEVWRAAVGTPCLAPEYPQIAAVVSDDAPAVAVPVWPRSAVAALMSQVVPSPAPSASPRSSSAGRCRWPPSRDSPRPATTARWADAQLGRGTTGDASRPPCSRSGRSGRP